MHRAHAPQARSPPPRYLAKLNKNMETQKKVKAQRIALRKELLFAEVLKDKEEKVRNRK